MDHKTTTRSSFHADKSAEELGREIDKLEASIERLHSRRGDELTRLRALKDALHIQRMREQSPDYVIARLRKHLLHGDGPFTLYQVFEEVCAVLVAGEIWYVPTVDLLPWTDVDLQEDAADWIAP